MAQILNVGKKSHFQPPKIHAAQDEGRNNRNVYFG